MRCDRFWYPAKRHIWGNIAKCKNYVAAVENPISRQCWGWSAIPQTAEISVVCVHCLAHCQLTMEQWPAHKALSGLYPPKRCFLPSAESYTEHGSVLQMAATAAHLVKAAESIALVFQERLMTRDPCYFMGKFQQLNPWAVSYIYLFTEKWCTIATYTSEQNVGIKSEKRIS